VSGPGADGGLFVGGWMGGSGADGIARGALEAGVSWVKARKAEFRVRTRLVTTELFPWALGPALALLLLAAPAWPVGARLPTRPAAP